MNLEDARRERDRCSHITVFSRVVYLKHTQMPEPRPLQPIEPKRFDKITAT